MNRISPNDKKKIDAVVENGPDTISLTDVDEVLKKEKEVELKGEKLGKQFENLKICMALVRDYCKGDYKNVPWKTIASIVFAVTYLLCPIDIIPDFIPIVGFIDDASVFALVIKAISSDIEAYKAWRNAQNNQILN